MKLSARLLLFLLVALIALPVHAKNPRWGKVVNVQIQGRSTSRQPEAPGNPPVALPLAATLESASQCPRAIVAFRNASSATLTLTIGEAAPLQIAPKQTQRVCAQEDVVGWQVSSPHGWQYGGRLDVKGLRLREETLIAPGATLQIVNATGETQRLQLDGHDIGKLEAGKQKTVGPVDAGAHTLLARGKISQRRDTKRVRLAAGDTTTVTWQPPPTWTQVHNHENEAAHVVVDGVGFGDVAAENEIRVLGLGAGKHQVLLTFFPSGKTKKFEIVASPAGEPLGKSPEIAVTVANLSGELLDIPPGLREWGTVMDVLGTLQVRVPRRTFGAVLVGRDSGLKYRQDFHARTDPDAIVWRITRPMAVLRVKNSTGVPIIVTLPDDQTMAVAIGKMAEAKVPAGRLSLVAKAQVGDRAWTRGMTLLVGKEMLWQVKSKLTGLIVASTYAEPLLVRLDGAAQFKLLPGKSVRMNARPGAHRVEARALRSGTQAVIELDVVDGERRTLTIKPPTGSLKLTAGTQPVTVRVRGVEVAEAQPGEPVVVPVTAGQVQAEVRDDKGRAHTFLGLVAPTQQVELALPAADRAALEIGWQGQAVAQVSVDGGAEMTLQPGASLRLDGIARGPHLVAIASGGISWRRWMQIDGQQAVARFVLKPTP